LLIGLPAFVECDEWKYLLCHAYLLLVFIDVLS
jgi:hypothetical protein